MIINLKSLLLCFTLTLFLSIGTLSSTEATSQSEFPEYKVKAVFIYNFAKFVEWPAGEPADDKLSICVLGEDPFGVYLNIIRGKKIRGRIVDSISTTEIESAKDCDCLFISDSQKDKITNILTELRGHNVLTISDMEGFMAAGGIIEFVLEKRKVRFRINMVAAKRAGFKVSSKLLELAKEVKY